MKWIVNKRLVVYLFPHDFLIEIKNTGSHTIQSYELKSVYSKVQNQKRALTSGSSNRVFAAGQANDCLATIQGIESGEKGYIYVAIYSWVPGDLPAEFWLSLCLRDELEVCQTRMMSMRTQTPIQDIQAVSDFELSFMGVFSCDAFDSTTTVFKVKNSGEAVLLWPKHGTNLSNEFHNSIHLSDTWPQCASTRAALEPGSEALLLLVWRKPPPPNELVISTFTFCSPLFYYADDSLPCPLRTWEFYMPDQ